LSLEFNKIVDQVYKLGVMVEQLDFDLTERLHLAQDRFFAADDLDRVRERVLLTRQPDVSGYRGAAPLDPPYHEVICNTYPPPSVPPSATLIAADGSQIYPDEQAPVHYYLLNVGLFVYHHGTDRLPEQYTLPELFYHKTHVHDQNGRVITNRTVDARRTVAEMQNLGKLAWELKGEARPLVTLYDNRLLFGAGSDVTDADTIMREYRSAMIHLHDARALLAGYVDNPRSRLVILLLHLLSLTDDEVRHTDLSSAGDMEGLDDAKLFASILYPGERSAIMVQNSPQNFSYRQMGENYEIAFFYVKVSSGTRTMIARVDIPMWVARDKRAVDDLHALILAQSEMQGRNPYPYALTRADELAHVSGKDKNKLDELIHIELRKKGIDPTRFSAKDFGKELARAPKRYHEM
jgi:hypothetical protein